MLSTTIDPKLFMNKVIKINRDNVWSYYDCYGVSQHSNNLVKVSECGEYDAQYWLTLTDPSIKDVQIVNIPEDR